MSNSTTDLRAKRDDLNSKVKELLTEVKSDRDRLTSINEKINELKEKRDSKNKLVKDLITKKKGLREKIGGTIKTLKENNLESAKYEPIPKDMTKLKSDIKKLDWDIQTKQHTIKQDEQMRSRLENLEELLTLAKSRKKIDKKNITDQSKIDNLREDMELIEQLIIDNQQAGNKEHKELIPLYQNIKEIRDKVGPKFKEIKELKNQADEAHKAFMSEQKKSRDEKETRFIARKKQQESEAAQKEKELKQKAQELFTGFTKGKKLTSEELIIIQKYGQ